VNTLWGIIQKIRGEGGNTERGLKKLLWDFGDRVDG